MMATFRSVFAIPICKNAPMVTHVIFAMAILTFLTPFKNMTNLTGSMVNLLLIAMVNLL